MKVEVDAGEVILSVADDGPGLSAEAAGRVFERFYRGDPARSRITGGAGLGLSIVAAIVEAHGGRVTASSPNWSGAVFEVRLPARSEQETGAEADIKEADVAAGATSGPQDGSPSAGPPP
jgi:two-component system OmpR family sensor kinase